jgi:ABC-2 type transport system permease protein
MKLRRIWAMSRKEFLHVLRDPWSLGMALALPALMLVLFGYALTLDVDRVPLVVWDQDNTPQSRELVSRFTASRYFSLYSGAVSYSQIEDAIDRNDALAGLIVPAGFARDLASGQGRAQFIVDGSDNNTAAIAMGYADAVSLAYRRELLIDSRPVGGARAGVAPAELRPRVWFNTDLESRNYIVPGLIAVIMMVIAALLTSLTVAREWERGTMEQLMSTPVRGHELILGKLLPYLAIGFTDVLLAVAMGQFLFGVPLRGSVTLLLALSVVFLVGAMSLGVLISVMARSQLVASQMAILITFVPSYLLSGFMFAIRNMPEAVQALTYLVPARYFIVVLKAIYLKGVGLAVIAWDVVLLVVFAAAMVLLANLRFKRKL